MTLKKIISDSIKQLKVAKIDTARLDVKVLIKHVTGFSDVDLILKADETLSPEQLDTFTNLLERRLSYEPIAYLTGHKEFWGLDFKVTPDTLIPRPDSELFIETALTLFSPDTPLRILDLGTGSGCLLISLLTEFKNAEGVGADICKNALNVAQENATTHKVATRSSFIKSEWCHNVTGQFDLIISNPPYIPDRDILMKDVYEHEPHSALFAGKDGLNDYKTLIPQLKCHSHNQTIFLCEVGMGQVDNIRLLLDAYNFKVIDVKKDIQSIDRLIVSHCLTYS